MGSRGGVLYSEIFAYCEINGDGGRTKERRVLMSYKWTVACVVIFGIFMRVLDSTIVNIAIPRLESAFGAGLTDVDWVATGYTLAGGVSIPLSPFLSGKLGLKRFY